MAERETRIIRGTLTGRKSEGPGIAKGNAEGAKITLSVRPENRAGEMTFVTEGPEVATIFNKDIITGKLKLELGANVTVVFPDGQEPETGEGYKFTNLQVNNPS
jgi:hypothetical protein